MRSGERVYDARVYPRVCGGTAAVQPDGVAGGGLSPRVRGNRHRRTSSFLCVRSIPACAGEPRSASAHIRLFAVYPRVCGGTAGFTGAEHPLEGLSPRVRGNPCCLA